MLQYLSFHLLHTDQSSALEEAMIAFLKNCALFVGLIIDTEVYV